MKAFSLIELLVSLVVIAILIALSMPALASIRRTSARVRCEQNMRTCVQAMTNYIASNDDSFPMFANRQLEDAFSNGGMLLPYFLQRVHWPMVVRPYLTDRPLEEVQVCPSGAVARDAFAGDGAYQDYLDQYPSSYTQTSDYWLSYTLLSSPQMWRPGGRIDDASLLRSVRASELVFPSEKGALVEARAYHLPERDGQVPAIIGTSSAEGPFVIGFGDGHVVSMRRSSLVPGFADNGISAEFAAPVIATPAGANGRDIAR